MTLPCEEFVAAVRTALSTVVEWVDSPLAGSSVKLAPRVVFYLDSIRYDHGKVGQNKKLFERMIGKDDYYYRCEIFARTLEHALLIRSAVITSASAYGATVDTTQVDLPQGTAKGVALSMRVIVPLAVTAVSVQQLGAFVPGNAPDLDFELKPGVRAVFVLDGSDVGAPNGNMSPVSDGTYSPDGGETGSDTCGTT